MTTTAATELIRYPFDHLYRAARVTLADVVSVQGGWDVHTLDASHDVFVKAGADPVIVRYSKAGAVLEARSMQLTARGFAFMPIAKAGSAARAFMVAQHLRSDNPVVLVGPGVRPGTLPA